MRLQWRRLRISGKGWSPPHIAFTVLLVSLCFSCYVSLSLFERTMPQSLTVNLALTLDGLKHGHYWQFFTCFFWSPTFLELVSSLLLLFLAGRELESIAGPRHVAGVFLSTILPANLASLAWPSVMGQMGTWPASCGMIAVLATMLPMLEMRWRLGTRSVSLPLRTVGIFSLCLIFGASCVGWLRGNAPITVPVAGIAGYLYARSIGYGFPSAPEIYFRQRRLLQERRAQLSSAQFIEQEVDPILEKIQRSGLSSLTRSEKKTLQESATRLP